MEVSGKSSRWEEYDIAELGRLMIVAGELHGDVDALNFLHPTEDETEALIDARYYAHKLFKILGRLAINAEREWKNVANET